MKPDAYDIVSMSTGNHANYGNNMPNAAPYQQQQQAQQPAPAPSQEADSNEEVWVETKSGDGKSYYYHAKSRETTWNKPEGPNVKVLSQQQVYRMMLTNNLNI